MVLHAHANWLKRRWTLVVDFLTFTADAFQLFRTFVPRFPVRLIFVIFLEFLAALCSGFSFALLVPFLQQLTGTTQGQGPYAVLERVVGIEPTLATLSALLFLGVLLRNGLSVWSAAVQTGMAAQLTQRLRSEVFSAYVNSDLKFFAKAGEGKAISALTGEIERTKKILFTWRRGIASIVSAVTYLAILLVLSPRVTVSFLAASTVLLVGLMQFYYRLRQNGFLVSALMERLNSRISDMLHCFVVVKSLGAEDVLREAFGRDGWEYARAERRQSLLTVWNVLILEVGFYFAVLVVLIYIYHAYIVPGVVSPFTVIAYVVFASRFVEAVLGTSGPLAQLFHDAAAFDRLREAISIKPIREVTYGDVDMEHVTQSIEVEHVSVFHDGIPVLDDVSFRVPAGQIVAIVGPSGSGKTTLALLLAGLYRPDKGEIRLDGLPVSKFTRASLIRSIAFQPQETRLFSGSIRHNLMFGLQKSADEAAVRRVLEDAQLTELVGRRESAGDGAIGEKGATLSAGERQRILFARALLRNPCVLVLDEVTSALDLNTEARILEGIASLRGRRTVIFVTHRLHSAKIADWIVVINQGRVVEQGTFSDLLATRGAFAVLYQRER